MPSDYQPRLSIVLPEEQFHALREYIPWGVRNQLFLVIIDDLLKLLSDPTKRSRVIAEVLSRDFSPLDAWKERDGNTN